MLTSGSEDWRPSILRPCHTLAGRLWRARSARVLGTQPICHTALDNMLATSQSKGRTNLLDSVAGVYCPELRHNTFGPAFPSGGGLFIYCHNFCCIPPACLVLGTGINPPIPRSLPCERVTPQTRSLGLLMCLTNRNGRHRLSSVSLGE